MRKFLFVVLILISNKLSSQNLDETITYINILLKSSTYSLKLSDVVSEYENIYDSISIDKTGKLECNRILTEVRTGKILIKMRFFVYLKSLNVGYKSDYKSYFICNLQCANLVSCFGGLPNERDNISFSITTSSNRDKLYNAFAHLIKLAKENKDFYEKDPFG